MTDSADLISSGRRGLLWAWEAQEILSLLLRSTLNMQPMWADGWEARSQYGHEAGGSLAFGSGKESGL